jgi:hypothetical protein
MHVSNSSKFACRLAAGPQAVRTHARVRRRTSTRDLRIQYSHPAKARGALAPVFPVSIQTSPHLPPELNTRSQIGVLPRHSPLPRGGELRALESSATRPWIETPSTPSLEHPVPEDERCGQRPSASRFRESTSLHSRRTAAMRCVGIDAIPSSASCSQLVAIVRLSTANPHHFPVRGAILTRFH